MRLRRVFIFLAIILFVSTAYVPRIALAEDSLVGLSDAQVTPSSLSGAGSVQVSVSVSVDPSRPAGITGALIDGPGVDASSEAPASVQPGDSQTLACTLNVTADQLGKPIQLKMKWQDAETGASDSNPFAVTVDSHENRVSFTRTVSPDKQSLAKGDKATLTYVVRNLGSTDITGITVTDGGIPGMSGTRDVLAAGDSITFTHTVTISSDFISSPKLTYAQNGTPYNATCASKTIELKIVQMEAVLETMPSTIDSGGNVTLRCELSNTGNTKLTGIVISDAQGNRLFTEASLDPGPAPKTYSRNIELLQTTKFKYTITAKDDSGRTVTFQSNEVVVMVSSANNLYDLAISASPDAIQLAAPGTVNFNIRITNSGSSPAANAMVTDQEGRIIGRFEALPPGDTSFTYGEAITSTTQFTFSVVVPGEQGNYLARTEPLEIKLASETPATAQPTASPAPTPADTAAAASSGAASASSLDVLLKVMLVVAALIAVTIVVLLVMIISDRRKRKNQG